MADASCMVAYRQGENRDGGRGEIQSKFFGTIKKEFLVSLKGREISSVVHRPPDVLILRYE